ncbi:MAG: FISUMP domain-containing protein [bacterium]
MKNIFYLLILFAFTINSNAQWQPGDVLVDSRDGQTYRTVVIGTQVWMAENLNIGEIIPSTKAGAEMSDNGVIEKYCWDNDIGNCDGVGGKMKRGGFYEWEEAMQFWSGQPTLPVRGICPEGWHIPSNTEWNEFFAYLGNTNPYTKMLEGGESGFDALLTGYRCTMYGTFRESSMYADTRTYFWTSEQTDLANAPIIELGVGSLSAFSFLKSVGLCIRCLWDGPASEINEKYEPSGSLNLEINPNPTDYQTTIKVYLAKQYTCPVKIKIFDLLGYTVAIINSKQLDAGIHTFNFENDLLQSGIYYIIASTDNINVSVPLMIIR